MGEKLALTKKKRNGIRKLAYRSVGNLIEATVDSGEDWVSQASDGADLNNEEHEEFINALLDIADSLRDQGQK